MELEFQHSFYLCSASVGHHPFPIKPEQTFFGLWVSLATIHHSYVATDFTLLHTRAATPVFSQQYWYVLWDEHFGGQERNLSLVSKFLWRISLKITRTVLFCRLSGNWMQDSLSLIPCSRENTAFEMFEHWCNLMQLWEKGRFFSTCVHLAKGSWLKAWKGKQW